MIPSSHSLHSQLLNYASFSHSIVNCFPEFGFSSFSSKKPAEPETILSRTFTNGISFSLRKGDITRETTQVIVNAANGLLEHGGGVAKAIVRQGGQEIQNESRKIIDKRSRSPIRTGNVAFTSAGHLDSNYVIHTVGPIWRDKTAQHLTDPLLQDSVKSALDLAFFLFSSTEDSPPEFIRSIAFPAISCGIYSYPVDLAASIIVQTILEYIKNPLTLESQGIRILSNFNSKANTTVFDYFQTQEEDLKDQPTDGDYIGSISVSGQMEVSQILQHRSTTPLNDIRITVFDDATASVFEKTIQDFLKQNSLSDKEL